MDSFSANARIVLPMTMNLVCNPHKSVCFFETATGILRRDVWDLLTLKNLRAADFAAHTKNMSNFVVRPDRYSEVMPGITPIPPRSRWSRAGKQWIPFSEINYQPLPNKTIEDVLHVSRRILRLVDSKAIAIELSGGLDTSIIIGLLESFGIRPLLVGTKNDNYEFRTERQIQGLYEKSMDSVLLCNQACLPFSKLDNCPSHQLPSSTSIFYSHAAAIAGVCLQKQRRVLFNGMGFDGFLCDYIPNEFSASISDLWSPWALDDNWFNEYVYTRCGISYNSGAASRYLMRIIVSMRAGKGEDLQKRWARKAFERYLPSELAQYTYKGDNCGPFIEGFLGSEETIRKIFKEAYRITKSPIFTESVVESFAASVHKNDDVTDKMILSRVSLATWIYGLARDEKIK
jgi:hypothetical protein